MIPLAMQHAVESTLVDAPAPAGKRAATPLIALSLALGVLWFVCCRHLSGEWRFNEQYSYGWFVPFFALYLFWLRWVEGRPYRTRVSWESGLGVRSCRPPSPGTGPRPSLYFWLASAAIIAAALMVLPLRVFEIANPDWRPLGWVHALAATSITLAVIYLIGGGRWLRHFSFPVLFFLTAVPWPSPIEVPIVQGLMQGVAAAAAETVTLFGIPAQVEGNLIHISSGVVGINEACSGVRSLQTSLMIALLFGELKRLTVSRRLLLVLVSVAIALFANFLRVLFLVSVASSSHDLSGVDRWHDFAGYAIVLLVFAGTMWAAGKFKPSRVGQALPLAGVAAEDRRRMTQTATRNRCPTIPAENFPPADLHAVGQALPLAGLAFSFLLLTWLVAVEIGVETWYRVHERQMPATQHWTVRWPKDAPGLQEVPIEDGVRATLRCDQAREVSWKISPGDSNAQRCFLFFARWNPGGSSVVRARAHRPDICLPSQGWRALGAGTIRNVTAADGLVLPFRRVDFESDHGRVTAHTFFCLQEDRRTNEARPDLAVPVGIQPDWALLGRWRAVREGVRNMGQQVLEIIIVTRPELADATVDERFAELLKGTVINAN